MSNKLKKIALFISSGIGNAVMMLPLLKSLSTVKTNYLTLFLDSPFVSKDFLIFNSFPYDETIELTKINKLNYLSANMLSFDIIYLDYSSSSLRNIFLSRLISKKIVCFRKNHLPGLGVEYRKEERNTHAVVLGLQLLDKDYLETEFDISQLRAMINDTNIPDVISEIEDKGKIAIAIQPSSANFNAPYKNWPVEYWAQFLNIISIEFSEFVFIILGDENEFSIGQHLENQLECTFINLIGKTNLIEMCQVLYSSKLYLGLDSGLMHLAVAYGKPTFSIFGASSYELFGYEKFNSLKHKVEINSLNCYPCNGYSRRNKLRVNNPNDCPDNICLINKKPDEVADSFIRFYNELKKFL